MLSAKVLKANVCTDRTQGSTSLELQMHKAP